ncbi:MAG: MBL fold metallo-hydrolase [Planctomycetota bacterium]|nr:MAG: MBL fold metallo-hydrolase [Planctomycetota bacterium]
MIIDTIVLGDFQTNCFCVRRNEEAGDCLIIDPGMAAGVLVRMLQKNDYTPVEIVLTHGHADHIGGVETLRQHWPEVQVAIHKEDAAMLTSPADNLSLMAGGMIQARPAEILLNSEDTDYAAAGLQFRVLHTPGHTPGGICLYAADEEILFAGDTLFSGSIGRSDFPGGNHRILIEMIRKKLLTLPEQTTVYTGHGPATTIENEKKFNPFLT